MTSEDEHSEKAISPDFTPVSAVRCSDSVITMRVAHYCQSALHASTDEAVNHALGEDGSEPMDEKPVRSPFARARCYQRHPESELRHI